MSLILFIEKSPNSKLLITKARNGRLARVCGLIGSSAWLIRNYIDSKASFIWLKSPKDCPKTALGFDFDGATFTHADGLVTFEVLAQSFGINEGAIKRLGAVIHALDVGGIQPPEAQGVEAIIAGIKASSKSDEAVERLVAYLMLNWCIYEKGVK
jgi:hypothetical protein